MFKVESSPYNVKWEDMPGISNITIENFKYFQ